MYKISLSLAVVALMSLPAWTEAQTIIDTTAATGIGTSIDASSASVPVSVRDQVRAQYGSNTQSTKTNQEVKNTLVENREKAPAQVKSAAQTKTANPTGIKAQDLRRMATSTNMASSTKNRFMVVSQYQNKKTVVLRQLRTALNNVIQIRDRIASRMQKERQNTRDMSKAQSALAIADGKIAAAKEAVKAVENFNPATASASTTPGTIDAEATRTLILNANASIKEAKRSLNDVVVAIAKSMGLKIGQDGRIPNPIASTTPSMTPAVSPTASTTPTISPTATTSPAL